MVKVNPLGAFMRSYGLKLLYFPYVAFSMYIATNYCVEQVGHLPEPPTYPWYKTVWMTITRINGIILLLPSLAFAATYFLAKLPNVNDGPDTNVQPGTVAEESDCQDGRKKSSNRDSKSGLQNALIPVKDHLACFIIRIITRGEYPDLIKRNVAFHIKLFEKYCRCDHLEAHIVTEKPLGIDYDLGKTGRAKEILVPRDYRPKAGTLAKARNMAYWMEATSLGEFGCPEDPTGAKTWILSLDEDVFVTEEFMIDFLRNFLPSGAHCSVSPSLINLPHTATLANGVEESFFVTLQAMGMWLECGVFKRTPLLFRGGAYVVRRDIEKEIGHEYQAELSITEDHVFGHYFADSRYKMGYINGWTWEGGAPDFWGLIRQRARWFRGLIYAFLFQEMSFERRAMCATRLFLLYLVQGPLIIFAIIATASWWTGNYNFWMPGGACTWPLDYLTTFAFANYYYANVFGAWHTMSTRSAIICTIGSFLWIGTIVSLVVHFMELVWSIATLVDDFYHRRQQYEVTRKAEK